jgi:V-type H+-transporting ATPase subunit a
MLFGVGLKTSNAIYFRKPLDFFFECIPMFIFAISLFGYMLFLIFYKWSIDWNNGADGMTGPLGGVPGTGYSPPALINTMISMALSPGKVKDPMYGECDFFPYL